MEEIHACIFKNPTPKPATKAYVKWVVIHSPGELGSTVLQRPQKDRLSWTYWQEVVLRWLVQACMVSLNRNHCDLQMRNNRFWKL